MFKRRKGLFSKKPLPKSRFTEEQYNQDYEAKKKGLETILGEMYPMVGHAIIPFQIGGAVDMYYFTHAIPGTGFATMELLEPDGSGPQPSKIGTYELVGFTKFKIEDENEKENFARIERRMCGIFTILGNYSREAVLNPLETVELPGGKDEPNRCLILDEYKKDGVEFLVGGRRHGLLLVVEVFRSEMEYAMQHGSSSIIRKLQEKGYYPYSDLDRDPVV